jgi:hypothetical protein
LGVLAGAKNLTGQTVSLKKVVLSKLDFNFFSTADKHKMPHHGLISIKSNCLSPPSPSLLMLVAFLSGV